MPDDEMTHGELSRWLERVEGKLDKQLDDHETRLRKVEKFMYVATGLSAALGSGIGSFVGKTFGG